MRVGIYLIAMAISIVILGIVSFNLHQNNVEAKSEILKKELLIFKNHLTGTVRAVDTKSSGLLEENLLRLSTFETFHSEYVRNDSKAQLTLNVFEQGIKYLLNADTSNYDEVREDLNNIFKALTSFDNKKMSEEQFNKIIEEILPKVETFRDNARKLSGVE